MSLIKITKDDNFEYCWTVDGNKYGTAYDSTKCYGFSDEQLVKDEWNEVLAVNGSLFYYYKDVYTGRENCYACGLEKSRGINNQETSMSAVTDYDSCMAIACDKEKGELIFGSSKWIRENVLESCYGAITGLGIMLSGKIRTDMHKGFETQWNSKSERTMIGEDKDGNILSFSTTNKITCDDLCKIAKENNFYNAICLDGGGSVYRRYEGDYSIITDRKIKNSLLLYKKKKEETDYKKLYEDCLKDLKDLEIKYEGLKTKTLNFINECQDSTNEILDRFKEDLEV